MTGTLRKTPPPAPATGSAAPVRPAADEQHAPRRVVAGLVFTELLIGIGFAMPLVASLSLKVNEVAPHARESVLASVIAAGAVASFILNPVFGHLSDRTTGRFGRRRPWILGGLVAGLPAAAVMATATSAVQLGLGWVLAQAAYNAALAALAAVIADRIPASQQATVSGLFGAAQFASVFPAFLLIGLIPHNTTLLLIIPGVAGAAGAFVSWALLRGDEAVPASERHPVSLRSVFTSLLFDPRTSPAFTAVWLQRFLLQGANALIGTFGLYYLMSRLQMSTAEAAALVSATGMLAVVGNVVSAAVFGKLASRTGAYRAFVVASGLLMALSMAIKMLSASVWPIYFSTAIAAIGLGAFYAVDMALVLRVMPTSADAARWLGVFNIAKALPQSIAPLLAPVLLALGTDPIGPAAGDKNYFALYLGGTLAALAAVALTPLIRHPGLARD
ncbi:MFS transporter [Streptomyces sp. NPDC014685]|uniref:MFS transporter n=1 Tax=Streptomyces sp. NPDC014685 TaxID=3364881 RepID=UPI003702352E